jgi:hypothetical protein
MAFEEGTGNGMYMPVAPAYGGNNGFGSGDGWWIILLLLACGGGWGGFGGGWGGYGGAQLGMDFPWVLNGQQQIQGNMSDGFRDQMLNTSLNSIQTGVTSGFGDVQTALCGGFAGVNATINGAQNALAQQLYTNQISDLERSFAAQTATTAGFTGVQSGLCDIRYGNATNTRDIIDAQNRGTQAIMDKLCQLELDGVKGQLAQAQRENVGLQNQLNMSAMRESHTAQNALFQQGLTNEVDALYNRLKNCPVNTVPVYGSQPIFTCGNGGCGFGNATGFAA